MATSRRTRSRLRGRTGNDTLIGGTGTDTALYAGDVTLANITTVADADPITAGSQAGWQVVAGAEGTDTLVGMEIVNDFSGGNVLLVGNGGFATIQDAVNAASDGDTILLSSETFVGNVTVDKAVTIAGANHGIDGTGVRGAESHHPGHLTVTQATGNSPSTAFRSTTRLTTRPSSRASLSAVAERDRREQPVPFDRAERQQW